MEGGEGEEWEGEEGGGGLDWGRGKWGGCMIDTDRWVALFLHLGE